MTDTYQVNFDNGHTEFHNNAACFASLRSYGGLVRMKKIEGKPSSISYFISHEDPNLLRYWSSLIGSIEPFKHVIKNIAKQGRFGVITVTCDVPTNEMLYVLGAFRLVQEYPDKANLYRKILGIGEKYCNEAALLKEKYPYILYLMCENWKYDETPHLYGVSHSNSQKEMNVGSAITFNNSDKRWGTQKNFSESMQSIGPWGRIPTTGTSNFNKDLNLAWRKGGHKALLEYLNNYGKPDVAEKRKVQNKNKLQKELNRMAMHKLEEKKKLKAVNKPINALTWAGMLDRKRNEQKKRELYLQGYRKGWRLNKIPKHLRV